MQVNIPDAQNRLPQLIERVQAGEEVVIEDRSEPVARLVPVGTAVPATGVGNGARILDWLRRHPLPDYARRTADEIDAAIEAERQTSA